MPWHIEKREGEFCVIKDADGSSAGCHSSEEKAKAQMRALYANEGTTAAVEFDWTGFMEEQNERDPVRIEVGQAPDRTTEAIVAALQELAERLMAAEGRQIEFVEMVQKLKAVLEEDRDALVASLGAMTDAFKEAAAVRPEVVVNVPEIQFPEFPEIPTPVVNVQPPEVNVTVEPTRSKSVKFERDPLTGSITSADISES